MCKYNIISATSADFVKTYFRKYKCPICGNELQVIKVTKFVFRNSEEAKRWNFSVNGRKFIGDSLFVLVEFFCTQCFFQIDAEDFLVEQSKCEPNLKKAIHYGADADVEYIYITTKKKKRRCPECGKAMVSTYDYKIVNSNSPEAKDYDFTIGGKIVEGNIEFRDGYFWCPNKKCDTKISFAEMKKLETGLY